MEVLKFLQNKGMDLRDGRLTPNGPSALKLALDRVEMPKLSVPQEYTGFQREWNAVSFCPIKWKQKDTIEKAAQMVNYLKQIGMKEVLAAIIDTSDTSIGGNF